jgi:hypothetical protein
MKPPTTTLPNTQSLEKRSKTGHAQQGDAQAGCFHLPQITPHDP